MTLPKGVKWVDRKFVVKEINKRKQSLPKLHKLSKTKKGREETFVNVLKILLGYKVKTVDELLEGLEVIIRQRRVRELDKNMDKVYNKN